MRFSLLLFFCLTHTLAAVAYPTDPLKPGPYPVGVTTTLFLDQKRIDPATNEPRTLVTEIWYPATDDARDLPKNKLSNFFPGGVTPQLEQLIKLGYRKTAAELDAQFWNDAVRDARIRNGKFPVLIFSHGNQGTRSQNTFWCDFLASHGYVIVSADHTANAAITIINGKLILFQDKMRDQSRIDRPKDMSFLLDQMTVWAKGGDSRFSGKLDLDKVGATGMSFGSMTAIRTADADPRFKAVVGMSSTPDSHTNLAVPSLYMLGSEDTTIKEEGNARIRNNFAQHTGPGYLLELKNGGHASFTDMFKIDPNFGDGIGHGTRRATGEPFKFTSMEKTYAIINAYSLAFLGAYLKGEKDWLPYLKENHWADELIWQSKNP